LNYTGLLKEKKQLEKILSMGGFGPQVVAEEILRPGDTGPAVIALRNRLIRMGYLRRTIQGDYSGDLKAAVINFQLRNGLQPDGLSGAITLTEINRTAFDKLKLIYAGLERRRWLNGFEGKYILVNIPDYTLKVIDNTNIIYESRVVVGQNTPVTRTPEFSKQMSHMIVNPMWYVPKSLVLYEYLPELKKDRNASIDLEFVDGNGKFVDRSEINFENFEPASFPYGMRQQPSISNALGKIKFMLPNRHNIYLHDTPSKHLFNKESRAFSHGCIRVENPFKLAYNLLSIKTSNPDDPDRLFDELKTSDKMHRLDLDEPMQVHIVYLTSWVDEAGNVNYRNDIYRRDEEIFASLVDIGLFNRGIVN
jgi:murein L,D-transpeptidase YcbB/YkuD